MSLMMVIFSSASVRFLWNSYLRNMIEFKKNFPFVETNEIESFEKGCVYDLTFGRVFFNGVCFSHASIMCPSVFICFTFSNNLK